jgi:MarR family transcriptional regulator, organic hydroperoxide resistance regulator
MDELRTIAATREGGFLIAQIYQIAGRIFEKKLKAFELVDITPSQGRILFALWREDNISIQELSQRTSLGKSTLTAMLDRLEEMGHIRRVPSRRDRRKIHVCLTEKDKLLQASYNKVSEEMTQLTYAALTPEEIDLFEHFLKRILNNLKTYEKGGKNNE